MSLKRGNIDLFDLESGAWITKAILADNLRKHFLGDFSKVRQGADGYEADISFTPF